VIETRKDGIKFKSNKLDDLNERFAKYQDSYEQTQKSVVEDVMKIANGYLDMLQVLNGLVAELDVYASFAQVAVSSQNEYIRPKLHPLGAGILKLTDARHPCLEVFLFLFILNLSQLLKMTCIW
jgi:DNA mismatch repair protein MSH2